MENLIIIILLLIIVFFAGRYIYSQKKSGAKCIGCTNASCPNKFKNEAVDQSLIDQIIEAGLYAPNARGSQSSIIIQIKDEKVKEELKKLNASIMSADIDPFYGAPVILIVLSKKDWPPRVYDGSCTMENMMLMANDLGLGSVWIHRAKEEIVTEWGKSRHMALGNDEE